MGGLVDPALGREKIRSEKHSRKVVLVSENRLLEEKFDIDKKTKKEAVARVQARRV